MPLFFDRNLFSFYDFCQLELQMNQKNRAVSGILSKFAEKNVV